MSDRSNRIDEFLRDAGWGDGVRRPLAGDASYRRYERITRDGTSVVLMDAPVGGDELKDDSGDTSPDSYNARAHLSVTCDSFVALSRYLIGRGLTAPTVLKADLAAGLLLLEDLGDDLFAHALAGGASEPALYARAIDALIELHRAPPPSILSVVPGRSYQIPQYDDGALGIETDLFLDWYLPALVGRRANEGMRRDYQAIWRPLFPLSRDRPGALVLRDYHAQNLFWLPQRAGLAAVGIIDFQDAVLGSPAYDVVSLLQDARRDIPPELEIAMLQRYIDGATLYHANFNEDAFRTAYGILGAQRSAKIIGIFTRLCVRDGKPEYLKLIPRVWGNLERNLSLAALQPLKRMLDTLAPPVKRHETLVGAYQSGAAP